MDFYSAEVKKLVEFAYYLHEKDMINYCKYDSTNSDDGIEFVPMVEDDFIGHPTKKLDGGIVCGYIFKEYGHSSAIPSLILDVVVGTYIEQGFIYDTAMRLHLEGSLSNKDISERTLYFLMLKPDLSNCTQAEFPIIRGKKKKGFFDFDRNIPALVIDGGYDDFFEDNVFLKMEDADKLKVFTKIMETLGFRRDNIIALLEGRMKAEDVFMAVAPPELAYKRVLFWNRRKYTFNGNVLVGIVPLDVEVNADIGAPLDELPFPFTKAAIIDASLVNTYGINFGENTRRHKLINVNSNRWAICYADLVNAVIEEPIDLSKVDATHTKFGHQIVINLDKSIGSLHYTEFTYAEDKEGKNFNVDEYGRLILDKSEHYDIATVEHRESTKKDIKVFAVASNCEAAVEGFDNGADGIGLVRIEDMLTKNGVPIYKTIFITDDEESRKETIELCSRILREEAQRILSITKGKRVVFRLLDAKLGEFLSEEQINRNFYCDCELRGYTALCKYPEFLEAQVRVLLEETHHAGNDIDILVPINHDINAIKDVKKVIKRVGEEIGYHNFRIGAMVEYVWFANRMDCIADMADFIAIGLNDLTEDITGLSRSSHDKCFALLDERVKEIVKEGIYRAKLTKPEISIGLCGLHTNFAENLEFFRQIQIDYITCNPNFISTAKRLLSETTIETEKVIRLLPKRPNDRVE